MGAEENKIAADIVKYCKTRHWPITRHHSTIPRVKLSNLVAPGWPDYIVVIPKISTVLLEVKTKEGKLSDDQAKRIAEIRANDGIVIVADSLGQFIWHVKALQEGNQGWRMKF